VPNEFSTHFFLAFVAQFVHARSPLPHIFPCGRPGRQRIRAGRPPCKPCDGARPRSCPRSGTLSHAKRPSGAYGAIAKRFVRIKLLSTVRRPAFDSYYTRNDGPVTCGVGQTILLYHVRPYLPSVVKTNASDEQNGRYNGVDYFKSTFTHDPFWKRIKKINGPDGLSQHLSFVIFIGPALVATKYQLSVSHYDFDRRVNNPFCRRIHSDHVRFYRFQYNVVIVLPSTVVIFR